MKNKTSKILEAAFFFLVMLLTFYTIFAKNDLGNIISSMGKLNPFYFFCAAASAVFFVCMEGFMIWQLLRLTENSASLLRCFSYSFIGFFFSGITPSATGGQPAQLLAMKKDGLSLGSSTFSLMAAALFYKLILALLGAGILFFWKNGLAGYLGNYMGLYYLGLFLNSLLVALLILVMFHGSWMESLVLRIEHFCIKARLCKPSSKRRDAFHRLLSDYQKTLRFLLENKLQIFITAFCTFMQRCSLFLLTYFIYRGFGLSGHSPLLIMTLQAAIYISVDMLPLPGSQGISEIMYALVFSSVFTKPFLIPSMCVTRGLSFYFLLLAGGFMTVFYRFYPHKKQM